MMDATDGGGRGRSGMGRVTMSWDPDQYLAFEGPRLRPALELLARIPPRRPDLVVDLGCGTGHLTRRLAERWPDADVVGVDRSEEMLGRARDGDGGTRVRWIRADIATWAPDSPVDVCYSNAALHWLDDHAVLLPRLVSWLGEGGVLAVQMPRNFAEPTHTCAAEVAQDGPWEDRLSPLLRPDPVAPPRQLHEMLRPHVRGLDIWETTYLHVLTGEHPVVEWTMGSLLRPLLAELDEDETARFLRRYRACVRAAYPSRPDGTTLLPFRRQFAVAVR